MEPGRKIEFHACEPCTVLERFETLSLSRAPRVPLSSIVLATVCSNPSSEPHAVGVAVVVRAGVRVTAGDGGPGLAEDDDPRRAPVDTQGAARADVVVDGEDHLITRVL